MLKKSVFLILILFLALGMTACNDQEFMTLRGQVMDRFSGQPLAGIDIEVANKVVHTNNQGYFIIEDIPVVDDLPQKDRMLKVSAAGYKTYAQVLNLETGDKLLDIKLESKRETKFFFVKDDGQQDIYKTDIYLSEKKNLTNNQANDWAPNWSVEKQKLLFLSDRDGEQNIYTMDADGKNLKQITSTRTKKESPVWVSADKILFTSDRDGDFDIYLMNLSGGYLKRLTDNDYYDGQLAYSANRDEIAYISKTTGQDKLHLMKISGKQKVKLNQSYGVDASPNWDKEQLQILFSSLEAGKSGIYQINPNGSGLKRIISSKKEIVDFSFYEADNKLILYSTKDKSDIKLKLITEENQERTILTGEGISYYNPEWKN